MDDRASTAPTTVPPTANTGPRAATTLPDPVWKPDAQLFNTDEQKRILQQQTEMRIENERYLRNHPELKHILHYLLLNVIKNRPENVTGYLAELATSPDLEKNVEACEEWASQLRSTLRSL